MICFRGGALRRPDSRGRNAAGDGGEKPAVFPRRRPFSLDISNIGKYNKDN
ncbi:hypothetical protein [Caproicibacter fermentans]|uniref:Uncharacterized protein n=1 Tax=Caproicibacter fermentans TaxID=2576756 RepID=A0A7G8T6P7_9FIRM|nr:hypothetical protein [Caproicibacter fermentans]QNK39288.1 hypothetical protein HCR03_10990 [Caproicibacter fermentans]